MNKFYINNFSKNKSPNQHFELLSREGEALHSIVKIRIIVVN